MKTQSTDGAMAVLNEYRASLIRYGRYIATVIARRRGCVHSREVRAAIESAKMLQSDVGDYWLGAVFNKSEFEWTGRWFVYSDPARNIHERTVKVWSLPSGSLGYERPHGLLEFGYDDSDELCIKRASIVVESSSTPQLGFAFSKEHGQ